MRTMSKHPFRLASLLLFAVCATGSLSTPVAASTPCSTTRPSAREESELRAVKVRAVLAGSKRTIDVEFLPELPVETARELALRALSVVEDPAAAPAKCVDSESHPVFFEHSQWQDARNALLKAITGLPLRWRSGRRTTWQPEHRKCGWTERWGSNSRRVVGWRRS